MHKRLTFSVLKIFLPPKNIRFTQTGHYKAKRNCLINSKMKSFPFVLKNTFKFDSKQKIIINKYLK